MHSTKAPHYARNNGRSASVGKNEAKRRFNVDAEHTHRTKASKPAHNAINSDRFWACEDTIGGFAHTRNTKLAQVTPRNTMHARIAGGGPSLRASAGAGCAAIGFDIGGCAPNANEDGNITFLRSS